MCRRVRDQTSLDIDSDVGAALTHVGRQSDIAQETWVARVRSEWINPWFNAEPWHAVRTIVSALAKQLIGGIHVTQAHMDAGNLAWAEVLALGRFVHMLKQLFGLVLPARHSENVCLQGQDGQTLVPLRASLQIVYRLCESLAGSLSRAASKY
jgi:hypothetical protein